MSFGYFPDFQNKSKLKDWYLKIFGYPYPPRRNEAIMVFDLLDPRPEEKILDIGCGEGIFTNELAKRGYDVTGIDISDHDLKVARKRAKQMNLKVEYIKMDAQKMNFRNNSFDKIYSISTIEHIPDDQAVFNECFRVLKPDGALVISVPSEKNFKLIKQLIKLPHWIKVKLFNNLIVNSKSYGKYCRDLDKKFNHYHRYKIKALFRRVTQAGLNIQTAQYNVNLISKLPQVVIHTLKLFEWNKDQKSGYQYEHKNEGYLAIIFPIFYLFYIIDRLLFSRLTGMAIIIKANK